MVTASSVGVKHSAQFADEEIKESNKFQLATFDPWARDSEHNPLE